MSYKRRIEREFDNFKKSLQEYIQSVEKVNDDPPEWAIYLIGSERSPYQGGIFKSKLSFQIATH